MWHDHPFSQRNKTSKIPMEVKFEATGKRRWTKFQKVRVDTIGRSS